MTISVPPEGNSAKLLNAYFAPLKVEAQVSVDMTVRIAAGSFLSSSGEFIEYVGGNSPLLTAPATDAKWVAITLTEAGVINVIDGVPSVNPVFPTIPSNELILAGIFIGNTATYITSDMVFDLRPLWQTHTDVTTDLSNYYTMVQTDNLLLAKADTTGTPEAEFILNADQTGVSSTDVMITAERGDEPNTYIRWFETDDKWQFTNDGVNWSNLGTTVNDFYSNINGTQGNIVLFGVDPNLADSGQTLADFATAAQGALADSALQNIVEDLTPQLGGMLDVNGYALGDGTLALVSFTEDVAAVNNVDISNSATGIGPTVAAVGTDTDIDLNLNPKGTGTLKSGGVNVALSGDNVSTFVNDAGYTTDTIVATNHYTKAETDGVAGVAGAKTDKVSGATSGDFAGLDASGNLVDLGLAPTDLATAAQGALADSALQNVVEDLTPQLGGMLDVNGNALGDGTLALVSFTEDAAAVNNIDVSNSATGVGPTIAAVGTDTDIDLNLDPKGIGTLKSGGTEVALSGNNVSIFVNDAGYTTDTIVATNHYTKAELDGNAGTSGAKVDKATGVSGNIVEFGPNDSIADSGTAISDLAPITDPLFIGKAILPSYTIATVPTHVAGGMIYVTDATGGGGLTGSVCFSNGTVWIDVTTGIAVA